MSRAPMEIGGLSRQRPVIMGISVAWVMLFHARFELPETSWMAPMRLVKSMGFSGVDVFFLVSGLGLAWSASSPDFRPGSFLLRRVVRLVPSWWAALVLALGFQFALGGRIPLSEILARFIGWDFFHRGIFLFWFPPAMLATYLVFLAAWALPWRRRHPLATLCGLSLCAWGVGALLSWTEVAEHLLIWTTRLPSFFLGAFLGQRLFRGEKTVPVSPAWLFACGFGGVAAWLAFRHGLPEPEAWRWGTIWAPFVLVAFPLSMGIAKLSDRIPRGPLGAVPKLLGWMGENSLELYLVHLVAVETLWTVFDEVSRRRGLADLCCALVAFATAPLLRRILSGGSRRSTGRPGAR